MNKIQVNTKLLLHMNMNSAQLVACMHIKYDRSGIHRYLSGGYHAADRWWMGGARDPIDDRHGIGTRRTGTS